MPTATRMIPPLSHADKKRFFAKIKVKDSTGCHEWQAFRDKFGYGQFALKGKIFAAHRVSYFLSTGEDLKDMCALHRCDNPSCVNKAHLFPSTYADNARDCASKGRSNKPRGDMHFARVRPERLARGEDNGSSKLNESRVLAIRSKYAQGSVTLRQLAGEFGVAFASIGRVINRKSWGHVA